MLSKKLFRFMHHIALCAMLFASFAPSISHALAAKQGNNSFTQEICGRNGKPITIKVFTTQGQQLVVDLGAKNPNVPTGIGHHLDHCPFCANPSVDTAITAPHAPIVRLLTAQAEKQAAITPTVFSRFYTLPPPAQAPPTSL